MTAGYVSTLDEAAVAELHRKRAQARSNTGGKAFGKSNDYENSDQVDGS